MVGCKGVYVVVGRPTFFFFFCRKIDVVYLPIYVRERLGRQARKNPKSFF